MNDKTLFYMIFLICQGKNEKRGRAYSFQAEKNETGTERKNAKNHRKNTDFSGKPVDKRGGVKYINHRMLALLNDEC